MKTDLAVFTFVICCSTVNAAHDAPLTILFSGSANGIMTSCHCPNNPWGGLAKRAWLINELRTTAGTERMLTVDSGDLFAIDPDFDRSSLMLKLIAQMDYQAVAIGDQELAVGIDAWIDINKKAGLWDTLTDRLNFPWLASGYQLKPGTRQPLFPTRDWVVLVRCGLRIGVVSVSHVDVWQLSSASPEGVRLDSPIRTIENFQRATAGRLDMAIVISHQGVDADRLLARQIKGVDLIISGHSQSLISPPEVVSGVAICQAGQNGENLGILLIKPRPLTFNHSSYADASSVLEKNESDDVFSSTVINTPRWCLAQKIIPLNGTVDDDEKIASMIGEYLKKGDEQNAKRLSVPAQHAVTNAPCLTLLLPERPIVLKPGESRKVIVVIGNRGYSPLKIERCRSKSPWVRVLDTPKFIEPLANAELVFEVTADKIDRFFRCEFTVTTNDPLRPVVQGSFTGRVDGDRTGMLVPSKLWSELRDRVDANSDRQGWPNMEPLLANLISGTPSAGVSNRLVKVELFYAPGCSDCQTIENEILPELTMRFEGLIDLWKIDVTIESNYVHFARLSEQLHIAPTNTVSVFVDGKIPLLGLEAIRKQFDAVLEDRINKSSRVKNVP